MFERRDAQTAFLKLFSHIESSLDIGTGVGDKGQIIGCSNVFGRDQRLKLEVWFNPTRTTEFDDFSSRVDITNTEEGVKITIGKIRGSGLFTSYIQSGDTIISIENFNTLEEALSIIPKF